jgi:hypothetical protein
MGEVRGGVRSYEMGAITQRAGERRATLVASSRPPMPTSSSVYSAAASANASSAAHVVASKKVMGSAWFSRSSRARRSTSAGSVMSSPATRMRSWKETRCGDVYACTRAPVASRPARTKAIVEPLPLVPATCTTGGRRFSGRSQRSSSASSRSSERSIAFGCRLRNAARSSAEAAADVAMEIPGPSGWFFFQPRQ